MSTKADIELEELRLRVATLEDQLDTVREACRHIDEPTFRDPEGEYVEVPIPPSDYELLKNFAGTPRTPANLHYELHELRNRVHLLCAVIRFVDAWCRERAKTPSQPVHIGSDSWNTLKTVIDNALGGTACKN